MPVEDEGLGCREDSPDVSVGFPQSGNEGGRGIPRLGLRNDVNVRQVFFRENLFRGIDREDGPNGGVFFWVELDYRILFFSEGRLKRGKPALLGAGLQAELEKKKGRD